MRSKKVWPMKVYDKPHQATYIYLVPHYLLVEKLYTYYACMACPIIKLLDKHVQ